MTESKATNVASSSSMANLGSENNNKANIEFKTVCSKNISETLTKRILYYGEFKKNWVDTGYIYKKNQSRKNKRATDENSGKVNCKCSGYFFYHNTSVHLKSKKHIEFIRNQQL